VFIGSSTEGLAIARAVQVELDHNAEVELWSQGAFGLSEGTLASLAAAVDRFDLAILVLTADDLRVSRGESHPAPPDNLIFELGLFMDGLGTERAFLLADRTQTMSLPTDLAGVTAATFEEHSSGNLQAALGASTNLIRRRVETLGLRPARASKALQAAADSVEDASARAAEINRVMARSRIAELEITIRNFAPALSQADVERLRADIQDLRRLIDP
jgi:phage terminase large subunit-like protein